MKTYTKNEVFDLIQPLIDENILIVQEMEKRYDYTLGILDANERLIKLQKRILNK